MHWQVATVIATVAESKNPARVVLVVERHCAQALCASECSSDELRTTAGQIGILRAREQKSERNRTIHCAGFFSQLTTDNGMVRGQKSVGSDREKTQKSEI